MSDLETRMYELEQRIATLEQQFSTQSFSNDAYTMPERIPFDYSETEEGIRIDKYTGFNEKNIEIPAYINGKPVVALGKRAFYFDFIQTVKLPETLKRIQDAVFLHPCQMERLIRPAAINGVYGQTPPETERIDIGVKRITIPAGVEEIGEHAFAYHSAGLLKNTVVMYCCSGTYGIKYAREYQFEVRRYTEFDNDVFRDGLEMFANKKHRKSAQ